MIDYFALLDQPKAPWLNLERLKEAYHQKTLRAHPDAQTSRGDGGPADTTFATLNEAYQVLQDPKRRLQHLLTLEGWAPSSAGQAVPEQLQDFFPQIAALTQRTDRLLEKLRAISNDLSRSLLKTEVLKLQNETKTVKEELQRSYDNSLNELEAINATWSQDRSEPIERLSNLYYILAYLTRWNAQLDEMQFQLSFH